MGELYRSSVSVCIRWREYTAYMHVLHSWTRQATGVSHKCLFLQVSTVVVCVWGGGEEVGAHFPGYFIECGATLVCVGPLLVPYPGLWVTATAYCCCIDSSMMTPPCPGLVASQPQCMVLFPPLPSPSLLSPLPQPPCLPPAPLPPPPPPTHTSVRHLTRPAYASPRTLGTGSS